MKFRNKKTGEVFDALIREKGGGGSYSLIVCDVKAYEQSKSTPDATHFVLDEYYSLAELNEEWEDFDPKKEPLIKDEKVRKAVRAWAEAIDLRWFKRCVSVSPHTSRLYGQDARGIGYTIELKPSELYGDLIDKKGYTLAELCGEED